MKECVDSIMFIFSDVLNQVNNVFDENLMTIEEKNDKHANDMKTSFVSSGYKLLMTVGLLCSDNNHQLQSRIADKKGIQHIMSYSFNNIALNNNNNTNTIQHIENKKRLNHTHNNRHLKHANIRENTCLANQFISIRTQHFDSNCLTNKLILQLIVLKNTELVHSATSTAQ